MVLDFGALWDTRRNVIQPITDWNKNQDLGGLNIQAMGIFLQVSVLGETEVGCIFVLYKKPLNT